MKTIDLKTKNLFYVFIFYFIIILKVTGQNNADFQISHRADNWVFGKNSIINFSNGIATSDTLVYVLLPQGGSTYSDINGNLLMFSDGLKVWDNNNDTICTNLNGNNFASQSALFVPKPGSVTTYYLFTVDIYIPPVFTDGINYTIIEYNNVGEAIVVSKNNLLLTENAQKIAATKHQNNKDYWIVVHGFGDNKGGNFYSYLLSQSGLDTNAVTTTIGHPLNGNTSSNNGAGSMKISQVEPLPRCFLIDADNAEIYF